MINNTAYLAHREELKMAFEKSIFTSLNKLGDKIKELDWFPGTTCSSKQKQAA